MKIIKANKQECLDALLEVHEKKESYELIETLIHDYFAMIDHMKTTSLYDVFMYEETVVKGSLEPLKILTFENENLKKEVNKLRKQLGLSEKFKTMD